VAAALASAARTAPEPRWAAHEPERPHLPGQDVSAQPIKRDRPADTVAGFLATIALFAGLLSIAYKPVRIGPFALVVALIAVAMGGRHERLATWAVASVTVGWIAGMIVCVLTERPLW
jgi:hypothetical protein